MLYPKNLRLEELKTTTFMEVKLKPIGEKINLAISEDFGNNDSIVHKSIVRHHNYTRKRVNCSGFEKR